MTVRKARRRLRREAAQKRGGDRQRVDSDALDRVLADEAFQTLTPQEFDLHSEELLELLDMPLLPFALLKLWVTRTRKSPG